MDTMNVKIDDLVFDRDGYDAEGDVLYLARGETSRASDAALTPEGHGVRYDDDGQVIGVTIIDARRIIERDGHLTITLPHAVRVEANELAAAFG
jgi:YD repeat-containing protein